MNRRSFFMATAGALFSAPVIRAVAAEQPHALNTAEMPSHSHGITDPGHRHYYDSWRTEDVLEWAERSNGYGYRRRG